MEPLKSMQLNDEVLKTEKSRTVKIFMVKYKCILIGVLLIISILQFIYLGLKLFIDNDKFINDIFQKTLILLYNKNNKTHNEIFLNMTNK